MVVSAMVSAEASKGSLQKYGKILKYVDRRKYLVPLASSCRRPFNGVKSVAV